MKSNDNMLNIDDVSGKLHLQTRLMPVIDVHEDNSAAALEVMIRFTSVPPLAHLFTFHHVTL
jgi:protein phosphatase